MAAPARTLMRPGRRALPLAPWLERLAEARHLQLAGLEVGLDEEREELVFLPAEEKVRQAQIREERVRDRAHDAVDGGGRLGVHERVPVRQDDRHDGQNDAVTPRPLQLAFDDLVEEGAAVSARVRVPDEEGGTHGANPTPTRECRVAIESRIFLFSALS